MANFQVRTGSSGLLRTAGVAARPETVQRLYPAPWSFGQDYTDHFTFLR